MKKEKEKIAKRGTATQISKCLREENLKLTILKGEQI